MDKIICVKSTYIKCKTLPEMDFFFVEDERFALKIYAYNNSESYWVRRWKQQQRCMHECPLLYNHTLNNAILRPYKT